MEKKIKKCAICGITNEFKIIFNYHGIPMCNKHKGQMYRHGRITDRTSKTVQDKNEIIKHEDYAELIIHNKDNTQQISVLIDLEDIEKVSKHKWRHEFKSNGKVGYIATGNSKTGRIYLHRFVLNYDGELEVDHINRNKFDNRKQNLRIVSQAINSQNIEINDDKNIELRRNNKYRVHIIRFGYEYIFGLYNTKEEAKKIRDDFLNLIKSQEYILNNFYYNNIQNKTNRYFTFTYNNKEHNTKMFKTIDEMLKFRVDTNIKIENT